MTLAAIVAGILFALVIVHFAFPGAPPPPSTRTIRQVPLDDEMVIRAGDTTSP
jgi:hypothetical protein